MEALAKDILSSGLEINGINGTNQASGNQAEGLNAVELVQNLESMVH